MSARAYHEATKHSPESVRGNRHFLDWDNMPIPFKVYTSLEPRSIAREFHASPTPALRAIAGSQEPDPATPVDLAAIAHLLYFTAGVLRRRATPIGDTFFRAAACTGNLHHIELYLACASLPDLDAGVYHFGAHDFALRRLRAGDPRAHLVEATAREPHVTDAPAVLALTTTYWRNSWKYQARAYRHAWWDGGTQLANLLAVAAARRLPAHVVLGFADDVVNRLLDVDPAREATIALVALGHGAPAPSPAPPLDALAYDVLPVSKHEVEYPEIPAAHAGGALAAPADVARWRAAVESEGIASPPASQSLHAPDDPAPVDEVEALSPPGGTVVPLAPAPHADGLTEPVEAVILRRGSARVFVREPIAFGDLSAILRAATAPIPCDFLPPGARRADLYLVAHAVDGLASGTWWFDAERGALVLLRPGSFRPEAGFLGLGQEIPADAAVNLYWLTALDPLLARLGERGYRAAQLEAAIGGGRTYLAAYALGLGASGLTFFDDSVTEFFSPHGAGKSVMFLMAVGVERRLRRRSPAG
ncbi:MAG TPA: SagB family peptide dehydrogenase [Candidatus Binatia bacterium]|nr:SagB family peptide dehydrogenase [Candidatus Binatia bacterium]